MRVVHLSFGDLREMMGCYQTMLPEGGFYLKTRQELLAGEELLLELHVEPLDERFSLECTVLGSLRAMGLPVEPGYLLGFKPEAQAQRQILHEAVGWHIIGSNRRFHQRFRKAIAVAWRTSSSEELHVDHTENISLGGAFVRTDVTPPKDSMLMLHIRCGGQAQPLTINGRVAWTRGSGDRSGMGVQFLPLDTKLGLRLRQELLTEG